MGKNGGKPGTLFHREKHDSESFPQSYTHYPQNVGKASVEKRRKKRIYVRMRKSPKNPHFLQNRKKQKAIKKIL